MVDFVTSGAGYIGLHAVAAPAERGRKGIVSDGLRPTICLVMIVKNESAVIERCLSSVKSHIDSWVIVDTGSEDDTCERIQRTLAGIPGRLEQRPFVDFGHNRTELMDLAFEQRADWLLLLDADMVLEVHGDLHELLSQRAHRELLLVDVVGGDSEYTDAASRPG